MTNGGTSSTMERGTLPEGFAEWAKKYFAKKEEPEIDFSGIGDLFDNPYLRMRDSLDRQMRNARKVPELDAKIESSLKAIDAKEDIKELQKLAGEVQEALRDRRAEVEKKLNKLYDETIFAHLDLRRDPNEARDTIRQFLKTWDIAEAEREVNLFAEQVKRAKTLRLDETDQIEKRHEETKLQNSQFARNAHQAKSIATRLIGPDGKIVMDSGVLKEMAMGGSNDLPTLMQEIRDGRHEGLPQSEHALAVLQKLQNDKELREKLESIQKPADQKGDAASLIRLTLGLPPDEEITDAHARQAALSGLMFQARQGAVGSCFATATACMVQRNRPEQFLDDIQDLFSSGKLVRQVRNTGTGSLEVVEVPLNPTILQGNLAKSQDVKRKDSTLHLAPDMVAGMDALGIPADEQKQALELAAKEIRAERALKEALDDSIIPDRCFVAPHTREAITEAVLVKIRQDSTLSIKAALQSVIQEKGIVFTSNPGVPSNMVIAQNRLNGGLAKCDPFDDDSRVDAINPGELLKKVVGNRFPENDRKKMLEQSEQAFLGQQDNLLMRCWEYTTATMVERMPGKVSHRDQMTSGASTAMREHLTSDIGGAPINVSSKQQLQAAKDLLINEFEKLLKERLETRYDPNVKSVDEAVSNDGHSSSGGYCLFVGDRKIESSSDYRDAMETALNDALTNVTPGLNEYQRNNAPVMIQSILRKLDTPDFRKTIIEKSCGTTDPKVTKHMVHPWTYEAGGDTYDLLQTYYNSPDPLQKLRSGPDVDSAEKLAGFLLNSLKSMNVQQKLGQEDISELPSIPVRAIGNHAFNLLPSNPGLQAILIGFDDPSKGLEKFKENEQKKNVQRNNHELPLDFAAGTLLWKMVDKAASLFGSSGDLYQDAFNRIRDAIQLNGGEAIKLGDAQTIIQQKLKEILDNDFSHIAAPERANFVAIGTDNAVGATLNQVVPKDEFEPLIDLSFDRLEVPTEKREELRAKILEKLTKDSADKKDLAKLIGEELSQANLGRDESRIDLALNEPRGLVVADANWGDGDHRVLMTMFVNPRTNEMELWQVNEDGTGASRMNQDDWVRNSDWAVFNDPDEFGGMSGHTEWEKKRGEQSSQLEKCANRRVGDLGRMRNALEIADNRFAIGETERAEKALENLAAQVKDALKLADNRDAVKQSIDEIVTLVTGVDTPGKDVAVRQLRSLAAAVESIRHREEIAPIVKRFDKLCGLLKTAQQPLGKSVDVETTLAQTA